MSLSQQVREYVHAAFSGLWIHGFEPDEAEREIVQLARANRRCFLPATNCAKVVWMTSLEGFHTELKEAETELDAVYGQIKADARRRLGRLYNPEDYPSELAGLFNVEWDFPSTEPPSYLRQLNPDIYQQEQERVSRRFEEAVQLAEQAFIGEFGRLVAHLTERLASDGQGERKVFRDSVLTNLVEFFERFRQLNVSSNNQLDELVV